MCAEQCPFFTSFKCCSSPISQIGKLRPYDHPNGKHSCHSLSTVISARHYTWISHLESESCSVVSNSLRPHGSYSPWNSPGQNTGGGSHSLLQGIIQPRDQTQVFHTAGGFFTIWATSKDLFHLIPTIIPLDRFCYHCFLFILIIQMRNWGMGRENDLPKVIQLFMSKPAA